MTDSWSTEQLATVDKSDELEIAARRADGTLLRWTPIWVVRAADQIFVRTWYRRDTGWFGQAVASGRARIRVPGLEVDVLVTDMDTEASLRTAIDDAYRAKYARYGGGSVGQMVNDAAASTTLRLSPTR
ncbi:DUF2255 family protein [Actinoplanes sp. LDG1-06]|uniref:DUF2255 family protein n=1 Tax=Paractinoplanes ovalisporus TaxID=2810368 RepID=A0ABS2A3V5_9ACTN|nr:DUF2255 family protein [Actinoplanes ovalisporus]MBM2614516.1 DUF2255 family protein [Actinoplanes ovalisporus]